MLMDAIKAEGADASGQNALRSASPYLQKAAAWDDGWLTREKGRMVHELRREEAERMPTFAAWVAEALGGANDNAEEAS
jgi:hypothetical protein